MALIKEAINLIQTFEGLASKYPDRLVILSRKEAMNNPTRLIYPYICLAGVKTIGYGNTEPFAKNTNIFDKGITVAQCEELFQSSVNVFYYGVQNTITNLALKLKKPVPVLNENQLGALTSFAYNLGMGRLKQSSLARVIINNPQDSTIQYQFSKWSYIKGVKSSSIFRRRMEEYKLYSTPIENKVDSVIPTVANVSPSPLAEIQIPSPTPSAAEVVISTPVRTKSTSRWLTFLKRLI